MKKEILCSIGLLSLIFNLLISDDYNNIIAQETYQGYYLTLTKYPFDARPIWVGQEIQGVTHDNSNWYFVSTGFELVSNPPPGYLPSCYLWKIPVTEDLNNASTNNLHINLLQFIELCTPDSIDGYTHWGDPDRYYYNGEYYIVVPVTSEELPTPAVIFFRASDLHLMGFAKLSAQSDVGWCAIDPITGLLITSPNQTYYIYIYLINWYKVANQQYSGESLIAPTYEILKDLNGNAYNSDNFLHNMQGGEFTSTGEILYLSNGSGDCAGFGDGQHWNDGIHAFDYSDINNIKEIQHSFNDQGPYPTHNFNYRYKWGCDGILESGSWSPEGLTIWDLDEVPGHDSNVDGQLHVLLYLFQFFGDKEVTFYHYGGKIYVDESNGFIFTWPTNWTPPFPFVGKENRPFKYFNDAFFWYPVWDGAEIILKSGNYQETGIYNKRVKITSQGGSAIIGLQSEK